jgi:dCTP deaminase
MILTGPEIQRQVELKNINIEPFNHKNITTNSYDLSLGKRYLRYTSEVIDTKLPSEYEILNIPETGLQLRRGDFVLAETAEKFGSDQFVPLIHAKSGTARAGLFVHVTADLIDIGSFGQSTLQLFATLPVVIYPGMKIAQVTFWKTLGEIKLYNGKYQNSEGPKPSMIYLDFKNEDN